jgi:hypothetical protein
MTKSLLKTLASQSRPFSMRPTLFTWAGLDVMDMWQLLFLLVLL